MTTTLTLIEALQALERGEKVVCPVRILELHWHNGRLYLGPYGYIPSQADRFEISRPEPTPMGRIERDYNEKISPPIRFEQLVLAEVILDEVARMMEARK